MVNKIKSRLEKEIPAYIKKIDKIHSLNKSSPLLFSAIKNFMSRPGKRIRPLFFVIGYLGFSKKPAKGLYTTALSLEILHDFILVHDDIIDKSNLRRGSPSMHAMLNSYLTKRKSPGFNGQDLAIIAGDVMYAIGIGTFSAIAEDSQRKETALYELTKSAVSTGNGEFLELIFQTQSIATIKQKDIYKIYDMKTADYSFSTPLSLGAALAGADKNESKILFDYGIYLGRAFQVYDDLLDILPCSKKTGKPNFTDLRESKKTILLWHTYHNSNKKNKFRLKTLLAKPDLNTGELSKILEIIKSTKTIDYAKYQISAFLSQAKTLLKQSKIKQTYKNILNDYPGKIISL